MNEKTKKQWEFRLKVILIFAIIILFFSLLFNLFMTLGDSIETATQGAMIENYIQENNLILPIPSANENYEFMFNRDEAYLKYFSKPLPEFHQFLSEHYIYDVNSYDCKYWSYVWTLYFQMNKDKHNWKFEYIDTENHIFAMVSNSSGYCLLDENNVNCFGNMGY